MRTHPDRLPILFGILLSSVLAQARAADFVVTTNADSGVGSLRWALQQAALTPLTMDNISFNLPPGQLTISPLTTLPNVFYCNLDARTQPGYAGVPIVRLDGSLNASTTSRHGFGIGQRGLVAGFSIVNFRDFGIISIGGNEGPAVTMANYIGVQPDGVTAGPNGVGVWINNHSSVVGGVGAGLGNVISGNTHAGIEIWTSGTDNHISNNYIGTTANGQAALPNGTHGVHVRGTANLIGDVNVDERNIISGNTDAGVYIENANNSVLGNWIGLNVNGDPLPNEDGILTYGDGTRIGDGTQPLGGNVISGNARAGIYARFLDGLFVEANRIGTDPSGLLDRGNGNQGIYIDTATNVSIGGVAAGYRNIISGNERGVYISGEDPELGPGVVNVQGNYIGLGVDGTTPVGNYIGAAVYAGDVAFSNNVISASGHSGLYLAGGTISVLGNRIGTDAAGMVAKPGGGGGISGFGASMTIDGNVIAGNTQGGISFSSDLAEATVTNNRIGINVADAKLANGGTNIRVVRAKPGLVIGSPGNGNRIGATLRGIYLDDTSEGVIVQSNYIGWIPGNPGKDVGHAETGIYGGGRNHQIGGSTVAERNVISKNVATGIHLSGSGHRIQGNWIGSDFNNAANIGNRNGIVLDGVDDILVGGAVAEGNQIRNNADHGIRVRGQRVTMLSNLIFGGGRIGIDLIGAEGPDANDALDMDPGANGLQNYPIIETASVSGSSTLVQGYLSSRPNANYTVQLFSTPSCAQSGLGEAQSLITSLNVLTDANGMADFYYTRPQVTTGFLAATATDAFGNTSEIGNCVAIGPVMAGVFGFAQVGFYGYEEDGEIVISITRSGGSFGNATVRLTTQPQSAVPGQDYVAVERTVSFGPGDIIKTTTVPLIQDAFFEGMENFIVKLSNPTGGATVSPFDITLANILQRDPNVIRVQSDDIGVTEPASGEVMAVFTVTMDDHDGDRTLDYTTEDGTALAGSDYTATSGSLVFATGETTKTISVPVKADGILENPETFSLVLSETEADIQFNVMRQYATIENAGGAPILFKDSFE
jgi:hypothetical protein